jgi:hypothetical protein
MRRKRYDWANLSVQLDPPDGDEEQDILDEIDDHDRYCEQLESEWYGTGEE